MSTRRPDQPNLAGDVIRSSDNRIIKAIRSLRQRKTRETERAFVVEGYRAVADAIAAAAIPSLIAIREGDEQLAANWFPAVSAPLRIVDGDLLQSLSDTVTPQGILAVFPIPDLPIPPVDDPLILVLDQIRDPGNLGTLIRTAAAAGVTAIYLTEGTVDPFNPKTVRSSVGAHFRIPLRWLSDKEQTLFTSVIPTRVVADGSAITPYDAIDWTGSRLLVIGSEAHGASGSGRALGSTSVSIPLANGIESLNAAAAGAIILFEASRQRRAVSPIK